MIEQLQNFLTFNNIFLCTTFGIIPFWLMIIIIPNSKFTSFFVNSIILPLILSTVYVYVLYQTFLLDEPFISIFELYSSLDGLYTVFSSETFLLVFWLHFLALNIFLGSWISRDGLKHNMPRGLVSVPLILVYLFGPLGLLLYWMIRVFYAKRLGIHD
tara:strand:+ start:2332 stop:2805 length:474 start_codon:yes stop_codon:yes gene_type:complete